MQPDWHFQQGPSSIDQNKNLTEVLQSLTMYKYLFLLRNFNFFGSTLSIEGIDVVIISVLIESMAASNTIGDHDSCSRRKGLGKTGTSRLNTLIGSFQYCSVFAQSASVFPMPTCSWMFT